MTAAIHTVREEMYTVKFSDEKTLERAALETLNKEESAAENHEKSSSSQKRSATKSQKSCLSKKSALECLTCELKEHDLSDCQILFEEKKPERARESNKYRLKKMRENLEKNETLKKKIEKLLITDEA